VTKKKEKKKKKKRKKRKVALPNLLLVLSEQASKQL
jgi:hypothetical protein